MVIDRELLRLVKKNIPSDFEARQLCEFVIKNGIEDKAEELSLKRKSGYPLQYILGEWDFFGRTFKVGEGVLIPRADTETLIETVLSTDCKKSVITDLCSGSGCIAVTLEKETGAKVYALEKSEKAFGFLKENVAFNNSSVECILGDIFDDSVKDSVPKTDIIVCNPPYLTSDDMNALQTEVSFEPKEALSGGEDGLLFYRKVTSFWKEKIQDGGYIFYEIGKGQEKQVSEILMENGFCDIKYQEDLCKIIRVVYARKK